MRNEPTDETFERVGRILAVLLLLVTSAIGQDSAVDRQATIDREVEPAVSHQRIEQYIEQLGSNRFQLREQAARELESIGLLAFEALNARRDDEDIEIRLSVRRIVERMRDQFLREDIDPALERYVKQYTAKGIEAREATISLIAQLLPQQGLSELARIARFEDNQRLSKLAALAIIRESWPLPDLDADQAERTVRQRSARVLAVIGYGDRVAVRWLRAFAKSLDDPRSLMEPWGQFLAEESKLDVSDDTVTSIEIIDQLRKLYADFLDAAGQIEQARETRREISAEGFADVVDGRSWVDWLSRRHAWQSIVDFEEVQPRFFERDAMLLYGLAEAEKNLGNDRRVTGLLARIDAILDEESEQQRYQQGFYLENERGLFAWAEREYRKLIESKTEESFFRSVAYSRLAELLHNQSKDAEAAGLLEEFLEQLASSQAMMEVATEQLELELKTVRSRKHFFLACAAEASERWDEQGKHLKKGLAGNATDADLLIAMYRFRRADDAWRQQTRRAIQAAIERLQREIRANRQLAESAGDLSERLTRNRALASSLNHFAWLVSNTEGDYREALRLGRKALELEAGDAGVMDTVARCFHSVGDLEQAVKYQRWAAARSPFESQIQRQLEQFEREWELRQEENRREQ